MKRPMCILIVLVSTLTASIVGCDSPKAKEVLALRLQSDELSKEVSTLKKERAELSENIQVLKAEIDVLKNEPHNLFARAYDEKNEGRYDSAVELLRTLRQQFPAFQPDEVASALEEYAQAKVEYERKQAEIERKREEETRAREAAKSKEQKVAEATRLLRKSRDEMNEIDWYNSMRSPQTDNTKNVRAYLGRRRDAMWLRFRMTYTATDWLFVQSVQFKVDGEDFRLDYGPFDDWNRDNSSGSVWEWKDVQVDDRIWRLIDKISRSRETRMRYEGHQYHSDREVSYEEKQALLEVISAYKSMGGEPPMN